MHKPVHVSVHFAYPPLLNTQVLICSMSIVDLFKAAEMICGAVRVILVVDRNIVCDWVIKGLVSSVQILYMLLAPHFQRSPRGVNHALVQ